MREAKIHFWKNELKPALFVQNIIDNGYNFPIVLHPKQQIKFKELQIRISGFQNYLKTIG